MARSRAAHLLRGRHARGNPRAAASCTARWAASASSRCAATCRRAWAHPGDLRYASELVEFIRAETRRRISTSKSAAIRKRIRKSDDALADLKHFKAKVDAGAERRDHPVLLQRRRVFPLRRRRRASSASTIPIVPGHHADLELHQLRRFSEICGAEIPRWIGKRMQALRRRRRGDPRIRRRRRRRPVPAPDRRRRAGAALLHAEPAPSRRWRCSTRLR